MSVLKAENLQKKYGDKIVIDDVSFSVKKGEVVGILGPNGAGKTTCFYMLVGLIAPNLGTINLAGDNITKLPMHLRARMGIGYLPQEMSIFRGMNVEENILCVLQIKYKDKKKQLEVLNKLLDEFKIQHIRKSNALSLSGGERRRVEIARALASDPSFILLDEPFAGVDPIAVKDIRNLVSHLKDRGIGVLITDHNVRETLKIVDRGYIIYEGRVLIDGTPKKIAANAQVRKVYLGEDFEF